MNRKKLLIVEDDDIMREEFSEALSYEGFKVDAAAEPAEALNYIKNNTYKVVLLDIKMHGDGYHILDRIRNLEKKVKIFIITGSTMRTLDDEKKQLVNMADKVFFKPVDIEDILKKIKAEK